MTPRFQIADRVVYRITKTSLHPEPEARLIAPAENGDGYSYCVDQDCVIVSVLADGTLVVKSCCGGLHQLNPDDPRLRHHVSRLESFSFRREQARRALRYLIRSVLTLFLATVGYFVFGIVVAIYAGLWLHNEKMYFAQGRSAHLFGATGAAIGVSLAWMIWRHGSRGSRPAQPI